MVYGEILKHFRKKRKLSAKEVATRLGISVQTYYQWESGLTKIPIDYIVPICETLNVSADVFLNYGRHSVEEYARRYNEAMQIVHSMERQEHNKDFIVWMFNDADIDNNALVIASTAYTVLAPCIRKRISWLIWAVFKDAVSQGKYQNERIVKKLLSREDEFKRKWAELPDKEKV